MLKESLATSKLVVAESTLVRISIVPMTRRLSMSNSGTISLMTETRELLIKIVSVVSFNNAPAAEIELP